MLVIKPKEIKNKMNHIKYHQINFKTMKSNFLLTLVGLAVMLAGCSKEEIDSTDSNQATKMSFTVNVDNGVKTRADVTDLTRYVMEVYEGATATGTPAVHKEQATGVFDTVILNDGQAYTVLFWADYGTPSTDGTHPAANEYNASDLKAARVADGKQPTQTAFAGVSRFIVGTDQETDYTVVKLTHATAQVNFKQSEVLTSDVNALVVNYPESYSLNVDDMSVTKIAGEVSHSFTYSSNAIGTLGIDYIIASTGTTKTVMDITATMTSGGTTNSKVITTVPFERNYRTYITGAYSNLYNSTLFVTSDDQWEIISKDVIFPKAHVGDYYYYDKTLSTNLNTGKTVIGIVFWVNPADSTKGRIVSLDEGTNLAWSTLGEILIGVQDYSDGDANTRAIKSNPNYTPAGYPAVAWCLAKNTPAITGISWYMPAQAELITLYKYPYGAVRDIVNNSLSSVSGATILSGSYWSSTEGDVNDTPLGDAVFYNFTNFMPICTQKNSLYNVRAVSAF